MAAKYCVLFLVLCAAQINAEKLEDIKNKVTDLCGTFVTKVDAAKTIIATKSQEAKDLANTTLLDGLGKFTIDTDNKCGQLIQSALQKAVADFILTEVSCITDQVEKAEKSIENIVTSVAQVCIKFNDAVAAEDSTFFENIVSITNIIAAGTKVVAVTSAESLKLTEQVSTFTTAVPTCAVAKGATYTAKLSTVAAATAAKCISA